MNRNLLRVLFLVCTVFCACFMAACGKTQKPKLVIATEATFPPYEYYEGEKIVGIDIDIMSKIAERLGYELVIQDTSFDYVLPAVCKHTADVGASGLTITEERKNIVNFTESYSSTKQCIIVPEGSSIHKAKDLHGKLVGVQRSSTGDDYVTQNIQTPSRFANGELAVATLVSGKLDAVVLDEGPAIVHVRNNKGLKILETPLNQEFYGFALNKDRPELLAAMDTIIREMKQDGTIAAIIWKYENAAKKAAAEKEKEKPVLTVAFDVLFPPYEFWEDGKKDGKVLGIDPDILQQFADEHGYVLSFKYVQFNSIIDAVVAGEYDIGASSFSYSDERLKLVDFSEPYDGARIMVVLPAGSKITAAEQLPGKRVGAVFDSNADELLQKQFRITPERYIESETMIADLATGKLEAVVIDEPAAKVFMKKYENLKFLPDPVRQDRFGFIVNKKNPDLTKKLSKTILRMKQDGSLEQILKKYAQQAPEDKVK